METLVRILTKNIENHYIFALIKLGFVRDDSSSSRGNWVLKTHSTRVRIVICYDSARMESITILFANRGQMEEVIFDKKNSGIASTSY